MCEHSSRPGFTLIELLIVIAIILILIAIALPSFLSARIRAYHTRVLAEHKTIALSLEQYYLDFNFYPLRTGITGASWPSGLNTLTSPIRYLETGRLADPFSDQEYYTYYRYWPVRPSGYVQDIAIRANNRDSNWYLLSSNGPDCRFDAFAEAMRHESGECFINTVYIPTNGTVSPGNIWRLGGSPDGITGELVRNELPPSCHN